MKIKIFKNGRLQIVPDRTDRNEEDITSSLEENGFSLYEEDLELIISDGTKSWALSPYEIADIYNGKVVKIDSLSA